MAKTRITAFYCKECGCETSKWAGQCPACHAWNSLVEEPKRDRKVHTDRYDVLAGQNGPVPIRDVSSEEEYRIEVDSKELNRVLGGGIVPGSLVLIGGDPGIGKSTLLMQTCAGLAQSGRKILYISGEESLRQIKMRADRLGTDCGSVCLLCETNLDRIGEVIREFKPDVAVVDSIQTVYREDIASSPGNIAQVRECTNFLMALAKGLSISIFLVGHVDKEGNIAGPKVMEHMVDTVLYFEGERSASYRVLRAVKNRFGSTDEIGVFEMTQKGLRSVENPSQYMLSGRPHGVSGSVVSCCMEGTRPMLLELQALASRSSFGNARRSTNGVDYNRMNMLLAVLDRNVSLPTAMSECDVYVNITGGIKVAEPAMDLGLVAAVISSAQKLVIDEKTVVFGEVGLTGEVRGVSQTAQRINEAAKLGFNRVIMPRVSLEGVDIPKSSIKCIGVDGIAELVVALLGAKA
ncbi:MAG: DNA repair protein RadA [Lachnospiraceae bacterium]|nr:DNA repair protein RadA [Lachnospiraceae bacterium]